MRIFVVVLLLLAASGCFEVAHSDEDGDSIKRGLAKLVKETVKLIGREERVAQVAWRNGTGGRGVLDSLLPKDCGSGAKNFSSSRLYGGAYAKAGEFPSFVYLQSKRGYPASYWDRLGVPCNGLLISDRHVLTAASCFQRYNTYDAVVSVALSRAGLMEPGNTFPVAKLCVSQKYYMQDHNIAVALLMEPVKLNKNIQPACLPKQPIRGKSGGLRAVGFGRPQKGWVEVVKKLPMKVVDCEWKLDEKRTNVCLESETNGTRRCAGRTGEPIYGLEDGRQVVAALFGEDGCPETRQIVGTDVYAALDELALLVEQCKPSSLK